MSLLERMGLMMMGFTTTALIVFGLLALVLLWPRLRRRWAA